MCPQSSKKDLHGVEGSRGWVSCIWFIGQSGACLSVVETFKFSSEAWTGFYFGAKEQFWVALGRLATLIPACLALHPSVPPSIHPSPAWPRFFTVAISVQFLDLNFPRFFDGHFRAGLLSAINFLMDSGRKANSSF